MPNQIKKTAQPTLRAELKLINPIEIFRDAFLIFKKDYSNFIWNTVLRAAAYLPILVVLFLYILIASVINSDNIFLFGFLSGLYYFAYVVVAYLIIRLDIQLLLILKKPGAQFWDVFQKGSKYLWLYAALLASIVVAVSLGTLLFVLPGLVLAIFSSLILCVAVLEDLNYKAAVKRSFSLVAKNFFNVLGNFILLAIAFFLVFFVIRIVFSFFPSNGLFLMLHKILSTIIFYLGYTFAMIYTYLIYKGLVNKK